MIPFDTAKGIVYGNGVSRGMNEDRTKGWISKLVRRLYVEQNGHPGYWVYHEERILVFDLTKKNDK